MKTLNKIMDELRVLPKTGNEEVDKQINTTLKDLVEILSSVPNIYVHKTQHESYSLFKGKRAMQALSTKTYRHWSGYIQEMRAANKLTQLTEESILKAATIVAYPIPLDIFEPITIIPNINKNENA